MVRIQVQRIPFKPNATAVSTETTILNSPSGLPLQNVPEKSSESSSKNILKRTPSAAKSKEENSEYMPTKEKNLKPQKKTAAEKKWQRRMEERERKKRVRHLADTLKEQMEAQSRRAREERKKSLERRKERERDGMVLQKISRTRAIKKLAPHVRRRLGIYANHELQKQMM